MDLSSVFNELNYWAVLVAALSNFVIGGLWYSRLLFGKVWMELNGFTDENIHDDGLSMPVVFGVSFFTSFISAFAMSMFMGASANLAFGVFAGFMIAVFWISTSRLNLVLYEKQKVSLFLIHASYDLVAYMIMGAILGIWH